MWSEEGKPQDDSLDHWAGWHKESIHAFWIDSWHMGGLSMQCQGYMYSEDILTFKAYTQHLQAPIGAGKSIPI